jgi:hypothetical protein
MITKSPQLLHFVVRSQLTARRVQSDALHFQSCIVQHARASQTLLLACCTVSQLTLNG